MHLWCTVLLRAHHPGVGLPAPAHPVRAVCAVASSSHVPNGGTVAREHEPAVGSSVAQHPSAQHLWASSICLSWEGAAGRPGRAALPLGVGASGRGGRCQDRAVRLSVANRGRQPGYRQQQGWARASRLPGRHAELHRHQHSTCHQAKRVSHAVLRDASFGAGDPATTQPLRALAPCTACTGTRSKGQCARRYCTKPRCKNSVSF